MCTICHTTTSDQEADANIRRYDHTDGNPDCIREFKTYKDGGAEQKLQDCFLGCVDCGEQGVEEEHCCYE